MLHFAPALALLFPYAFTVRVTLPTVCWQRHENAQRHDYFSCGLASLSLLSSSLTWWRETLGKLLMLFRQLTSPIVEFLADHLMEPAEIINRAISTSTT